MNYKKIYNDLINKFKNFENKENLFLERHHIIPRCLGGKDKDNIVLLPTRYHFIAHLLLWKSYPRGTKERNKLAFTVHRFKTNKGNKYYSRNIKINSKIYASIQLDNKLACQERMKNESKEERKKYGSPGKLNPMYGTKRQDFAEIVRKNNINNKGSHIYNNGIINVRSKTCPDGFVLGSLTKGRKYYNNGVINIVSNICPKGFIEGKLFIKSKWYNNGIKNIKSPFCPKGFIKGRIPTHKHWYNNGQINIKAVQCPEGFTNGKLHKPYKKRVEVL